MKSLLKTPIQKKKKGKPTKKMEGKELIIHSVQASIELWDLIC